MLPINSCRFILSIEFEKLTPSENLSSQKSKEETLNSTCLKKYVDQEFDRTQTQTQTQTQRLHEAEKNC